MYVLQLFTHMDDGKSEKWSVGFFPGLIIQTLAQKTAYRTIQLNVLKLACKQYIGPNLFLIIIAKLRPNLSSS